MREKERERDKEAEIGKRKSTIKIEKHKVRLTGLG
jgi:hypothetical protein